MMRRTVMRDPDPQSPCVVTGYACRLPGAPSASAFWELLSEGRSAIGNIGPDRFDTSRYASRDLQEAGTSYTFRAGVLDDLWAFDPGFFGFSPREAKQMDPQQRILLQTAWEAIEHAGLRPSTLAGGQTGVYIGASASDYSTQFFGDPARVDAPFMLGNTLSILSNRISYALDLTGPSFTVDTACSSSFYALDQARRALATGEIDTAIVGAVNVLMSPISFIGFSRAGMLSPQGRCAFLDAGADGYVRAEGAVVFVLRRGDTAEANGDPLRGHLLATGINSDGRTTGLALPSATRQAALMAQLVDEAAIMPDDIAFAEAHGTGTRAGDLAEATSLGQVYGKGRETPLAIGSAKSNVGHLEPASGLVGLLKAQMALEHNVLPATLHIDEPNPEIDLDALNLMPATAPVSLPERREPWAAVINSFGFGGANAHAILEAAPRPEPAFAEAACIRHDAPLVLSAASAEALQTLAEQWVPRLQEASPETGASLINQAAWRRERMAHTLVATGETPAEIATALQGHLAGQASPHVVTGSRAGSGRTAFVFSGNGAQWVGMGCHLFETDTAFRRAFSKTAELFGTKGGPDLVALLNDPDLGDKLDRSTIGQSLLFAVQTGLVQSLTERGMAPDAVAGHSVGEVAAAWCAGALSLDDGVRLIQARASVLESLHGTGGMAAVLSGVEALEPVLDAFAAEMPDIGAITLAADNNPRSTTISGPAEALDKFAKFARTRRLAVKRLDVPYPYHSAAIEPLRDDLLARIDGISPRETRIEFVSSATGTTMPGTALDPEYWWRNTRAPVQFRQSVSTLVDAGCRIFVEIGPRPVLQNYVLESASQAGASVHYVPTLEQGRRQNASPAQITARAVAAGARHDEVRVFGTPVPLDARPDMALPVYPWSQTAFRAEPTGTGLDMSGARTDADTGGVHPLLGWRDRPNISVWHNHLSIARQPWLADHVIGGAVVFPAAGYAELVLAAGAASFALPDGSAPGLDLSGLDILRPLVIEKTHTLSTTLDRETGTVTIESSPYPGGGTPILHARARIRVLPGADLPGATPPTARAGTPVKADQLYTAAEALGLSYGPAFRCFAGGQIAGREMMLALSPPQNGPAGCVLDPGLLDGAMHGLAALIATANETDINPAIDANTGNAFLPVRMGRLEIFHAGVQPVRADLELTRIGTRSVKARLVLYAEDDTPVARLSDLGLRAMPATRRTRVKARFWRQVVEQREGPLPAIALPEPWADPAARLATLELTVKTTPTGDVGTLLTDAACRRFAWDTVRTLAGPDGQLDAAALQQVSASAYPMLGRLLQALEEDALFTRDKTDAPDGAQESRLTGTLAETCDYPAFDELLCGLRDEAPARSADLLTLSGLADLLPERLSTGLLTEPATRPARARLSDRSWTALQTALGDLADHWPDGQRLAVLLIGTPPQDLLAWLLAHPALTRLTLTDPDPGTIEVMARDLPRHPALETVPWESVLAENRARDIAVVADQYCGLGRAGLTGVAERLAEGGLMLGLHAAPDLMTDLMDGQNGDWWSGPAHAPTGRRASGPVLLRTLARAGFADPGLHHAADPDQDVLLITGRGAPAREMTGIGAIAQNADEQPPTQVIFHRRDAGPGSAAALLRTALQDLGTQEPRLSALTPLIGVPDAEPWEGVVLLQAQETGDVLSEAQAGIETIQTLFDRLPSPERLWLALPGGCPGAPENAGESPAMAALWGYARTLMNEHPDLDIRLLDPGQPGQDTDERTAWAARLAHVVASPGPEREILTGPNGVAVPRIEPAIPGPSLAGLGPVREGCAKRLTTAQAGGLDDLAWADCPRETPAENEVEIAVQAAGLNFRDVMWAQGLLPEEALEHGFAGPTLGMECAGVVVRAGAGSGFTEGERVAAFASGALASHVTTPAATVMRIPESISFEAAASLPVVFATAQYALADLARVGPTDQVLIHGGAGGVGLAALQIARARGARVFATAGTPAKRRLLSAFGAEAVFDSRSLAFADQVREASDGGVDVVLNALAGEAMERSIGCLRPFGRFIELGKRDFFADTRIGLYPFHRNLSYFGVDLDELLAARPDEAHRLLDTFSEHLTAGTLKAPPYQVYQAGNVAQAFRLMQRAGHVGKIVLCPPRQTDHAAPALTRPAAPIRGGWLIAGGTGGFGLATAAALAARGAEKLWLTSRSGRPDAAGAARIGEMIAEGVSVETLALDITDPDAVATAFEQIGADRIPLRGVVHSAMVLRDRAARDLTGVDIAAVLAPKIAGATLLDQASRGMELDHFILYSSAVTLFGNVHQAPYVAANMALERIATARRVAGEPALAIGWGAIGDTGYLARDAAAHTLLDRMLDGAFLGEGEALDGLAHWQQRDAGTDPGMATVSFARLPWQRLAGDLPILATPLYDRLDEPHEAEQGGDGVEALRAELASLGPREALKLITGILITETAAVLHQPEAEVDPRRPLGEIGFDSLMAVELRLALEEKVGISLPLLSLADATTLTDVAMKVLQIVRDGGASGDEEDTILDDLLTQHTDDDGMDTATKDALRTRAQDVKVLG